MVTTRNGRDTAIELSSSPRSAKKRASQEDERSSAPNPKRKKAAAPQEEKSEELDGDNLAAPSPVHENIIVRPHPDTPTEEADESHKNNATLPVRNHVRFSSTSPPPMPEVATEPAASETQPQAGGTTEEEDSDDDTAPESISLSTAQAQTRAAQADTEKVVKEQEAEAKKRRKRRDTQLKAQAKESTKRKGKEDEKTSANGPSYSLTNIPALLPAELLATEAPIRRPTPPPQSANLIVKKDKKQHKHLSKLLKIPQDAAPKDLILQNNTHVRVLQETNPFLPPKAESRSKEVRESWMKGRPSFQAATRKAKDVGKMQRKTVAKSFV